MRMHHDLQRFGRRMRRQLKGVVDAVQRKRMRDEKVKRQSAAKDKIGRLALQIDGRAIRAE